MPTELNLEECVERTILEMRKEIPGRRTSTCKRLPKRQTEDYKILINEALFGK